MSPRHDYKCIKCGAVYEIVVKITEELPGQLECRKCKGECEKQFPTGVTAIYKGTGFHETDYE